MDKIVHREIFDRVYAHLDRKEITVITGARQTGKTTILLYLKDKLVKDGVPESSIKMFNLDLFYDLENVKNQTEFVKYIKEELKKEKFLYIFIDEVQRLENPGIFLKGIYDLNLPVKFVVTGSSSLEIKSKVGEYLTGRKRVFYVWPFSFKEYIQAKAPALSGLLKEKNISRINRDKILSHFYDYLVFGGYPRVVLSEDREEKVQTLNEIYSSYIEKDVIGYLNVKEPIKYSKLVTVLADQIGSGVNFSSISNLLGIHVRTLENYIHALEQTFVIRRVHPFFTNKQKEITKMPKIYFLDTGLRNFAVRNFERFSLRKDKGSLLENYVFAALMRNERLAVNYWRTKDKNEVDFVVKDFYGNIIPIEVKAAEMKKPKAFKNFRIFLEKYDTKKGYIVNTSMETDLQLGSRLVEFILPYKAEFAIE